MKILLLFTFLSAVFFSNTAFIPYKAMETSDVESIKLQAFKILKLKCNVCHEKKNKRMVFTVENMNERAKRINRQVFRWKRMPKGNDNKLSLEETNQLKSWIRSLTQN